VDFWVKGAGFGPDVCRHPGHPLEGQHVR
jgi:hypothetical protein